MSSLFHNLGRRSEKLQPLNPKDNNNNNADPSSIRNRSATEGKRSKRFPFFSEKEEASFSISEPDNFRHNLVTVEKDSEMLVLIPKEEKTTPRKNSIGSENSQDTNNSQKRDDGSIVIKIKFPQGYPYDIIPVKFPSDVIVKDAISLVQQGAKIDEQDKDKQIGFYLHSGDVWLDEESRLDSFHGIQYLKYVEYKEKDMVAQATIVDTQWGKRARASIQVKGNNREKLQTAERLLEEGSKFVQILAKQKESLYRENCELHALLREKDDLLEKQKIEIEQLKGMVQHAVMSQRQSVEPREKEEERGGFLKMFDKKSKHRRSSSLASEKEIEDPRGSFSSPVLIKSVKYPWQGISQDYFVVCKNKNTVLMRSNLRHYFVKFKLY